METFHAVHMLSHPFLVYLKPRQCEFSRICHLLKICSRFFHVAVDDAETEQIRTAWITWQKQFSEEEETHLLVIESPYRSLLRPLIAYIDTIHERHPDETLTVILPEFVVARWWEYFLHNQTALRLKATLFFRPGIVVIDMPLHLQDRPRKSK